MKSLKTLFSALALLLLTGLFATAMAQSTGKPAPKVIAVMNRAEWCSVCKANGMRVMGMLPAYTSMPVQFVPNDLTNATTKAASAKELRKLGVADAVASVNGTGVILLVDARTHKLLKTVSMAEPNEKIESEIASTL